MTAQPVWGFCDSCARWRLGGWRSPGTDPPGGRADGAPARCPDCGREPALLETLADGVGRITLLLDVPPGADLAPL